jgi:hypothetical protein
MKKHMWVALGMFLTSALLGTGVAQAQVPADIEAQLVKIGHVVDPPCTAKLYRPLMPAKDIVDQLAEMKETGKPSEQVPLYPGITISRDVSFGPDPKDVMDISVGDKGPASRPVLIYVPGGAGNKIELQDKEANAFYDNISRWANENGFVGVVMQRHGLAPGAPPDYYAGAKDVAAMIHWVQDNISKYHGNPDRMFIWAQSAGNGPVGIYVGHSELYPPKGAGVKGVIFMSGQFNILRPDGTNPMPPPAAAPGGGGPGGAGGGIGLGLPSTCGEGGANSTAGALPGRAPGQAGGPALPPPATAAGGGGAGGGGRGGAPQISQEEQIKRSSLPELEKGTVKVLLASGELDIGLGPDGGVSIFNKALHDELCKIDGPAAKDGRGHCPAMLYEKGESHVSEVFSIDTPDKTVSGPILAWMKSIK